MEVHMAIEKAKECVREIYKAEPIVEVGLEEVEFMANEEVWAITVGFLRNWRLEKNAISALAIPTRIYKVVRIRDNDGSFESLRNRETANQN